MTQELKNLLLSLKNLVRQIEEVRHGQDMILENLQYILKEVGEPDRGEDDNEASREIVQEA